jgi:hypothetical protein
LLFNPDSDLHQDYSVRNCNDRAPVSPANSVPYKHEICRAILKLS